MGKVLWYTKTMIFLGQMPNNTNKVLFNLDLSLWPLYCFVGL